MSDCDLMWSGDDCNGWKWIDLCLNWCFNTLQFTDITIQAHATTTTTCHQMAFTIYSLFFLLGCHGPGFRFVCFVFTSSTQNESIRHVWSYFRRNAKEWWYQVVGISLLGGTGMLQLPAEFWRKYSAHRHRASAKSLLHLELRPP